jgi:hypothetical protein
MHQVCHERLSSRLLEHLEHLEHLVLESDSRLHAGLSRRALSSLASPPLTPRRRAAGRCALPLDRRRPARELNRASAREEGARGSGCTRAPGEKDQNKEHCMCAIVNAVNAMAAIMGTWVKGHAMAPPRRDAMRGVCPAGPWRGPWGRACGGRVLVGCCRAQHPTVFDKKDSAPADLRRLVRAF